MPANNTLALEASTATARTLSSRLGPRAAKWARTCAIVLLVVIVALVAIARMPASAVTVTNETDMNGVPTQVIVTFDDGSKLVADPNGTYISDSGGQAAEYVAQHGKSNINKTTVESNLGQQTTDGEDLVEPNSIFDSLIAPWAEALFEAAGQILFTLASSDLLTKPFDALFGQNSWVFSAIKTINETIAVPTAHSVLALMIMVQIFSVARRASSGDVLPGFKDIAVIVIFFVCFSWAINHSMEICSAIYTAFVDMIVQVQSIATGATGGTLPEITAGSGGMMGVKLIIGLMLLIAGIVAYVATTAMLLARSLQIYVMAMFSPIPLACLGADLTRSMGIGFLKNFVAACLAGVIIMLLILLYPALYSGILGDAFSLGEGFMGCIALLALPTLMTMGMAKSGSWAKELLGS